MNSFKTMKLTKTRLEKEIMLTLPSMPLGPRAGPGGAVRHQGVGREEGDW